MDGNYNLYFVAVDGFSFRQNLQSKVTLETLAAYVIELTNHTKNVNKWTIKLYEITKP